MDRFIEYAHKHAIAWALAGFFIAVLVSATSCSPRADDSRSLFGTEQSVVRLSGEKGMGTGFVVNTPAGLRVVSNNHVCEIADAGNMIAESRLGVNLLRVLESDPATDLCILSAPEGAQALPLSSAPPSRRETLFIPGHPQGGTFRLSTGTYYGEEVKQIVMGMAGPAGCPAGTSEINALFFILCAKTFQLGVTTARAFPGNSGSPVLNASGEVIGVLNSGDGTMNDGYFIPLRDLKRFLRTRVHFDQ